MNLITPLPPHIPPNADERTMYEINFTRSVRRKNKIGGRLQAEMERYFEKCTTKHLLAILAGNRSNNGWDAFENDFRDTDGLCGSERHAIEEYAVRNVLAKRPHVMRKRERKKLILRQRGQGKSRNR